jgi:hypothetical protein
MALSYQILGCFTPAHLSIQTFLLLYNAMALSAFAFELSGGSFRC